MNTKIVGSIKLTNQKPVGKFYKPSSSTASLRYNHNTPKKAQKPFNNEIHRSSNKKRSNSVGKIYVAKSVNSQQQLKYSYGLKLDYDNLINYGEIQQKLSNYLGCTIRTNGRQKYNYLSQHYIPSASDYQIKYGKNSSQQTGIKENRNALQAIATNNYNNIRGAKQNVSNKYKKQFSKENNNLLIKKSSNQKVQQFLSKQNKQNFNYTTTLSKQGKHNNQSAKKYGATTVFSINHQQNKQQLQNKLKSIINSYQNKNKELTTQMQKLYVKAYQQTQQKPQSKQTAKQQQSIAKKDGVIKEEFVQQQCFAIDFLNEVFSKLIEFNLKSICLTDQCDQKLQQLWKHIHKQIIVDQRLRVSKLFISDLNAAKVLQLINLNRFKKIQVSVLKTHSQEYDPFLVQKFAELFKTNNPNLSTKGAAKWVADTFVKYYDQSQRHWLKHLSQQKMQCSIKAIILQKQLTALRRIVGISKELSIRDFTRYLSTLFKANLRNRDIYQIHNKVKGLSYIGRFMQLLEERAGKGTDLKKFSTAK